MNVAHWLTRAALRAPAAPGLMLGLEVTADYRVFDAAARALARSLRESGLSPGDRVAIFSPNRPEYLIAMFGVWAAGLVAVPVNAKLHEAEAAWIAEDAGARLALTTGAPDIGVEALDLGGDAFAAMTAGPAMPVADRGAEDLAWLFYTSGTTGRPKGVRITHGMLAAATLAYPVDVDAVRAKDAALYAAPMSHGAGFYSLVHTLYGAAHLVPPSRGFDEDEVLDLSAAHGSTSFFAAPTMVRRLVDRARGRGLTGEGARTIVYGGGPMYVADIEDALDLMGPRFVQIYGQGECPMCITSLRREEIADTAHPDWRARLASVGRAQSVVELRAGADEPAEIEVKGAPVMQGYWRNEAASDAALSDGWLKTGDMGVLDADGFLTLMDRSKDLIISGGTNIYPREVEEALLTHPAVAEVAVVGRPSAEWGEEVAAFIVAAPGAAMDPAALETHLRARIAGFKRPRHWVAVEGLPKNNYGKVLKTALRARLERG